MVLMMDANEDVIYGVMCRQLRKADVGMREAVHVATKCKGPNMYFKGSEAIDGIWTTTEIELMSAVYLPFDQELGDHRQVIANMPKRSIVGGKRPRIQKACRRLKSTPLAVSGA